MNDDLTNEIVKLSPPVGVSTLSIMGIPLSDMVYIMTILYILVQIVCTLYRTIKKTQSAKENKP